MLPITSRGRDETRFRPRKSGFMVARVMLACWMMTSEAVFVSRSTSPSSAPCPANAVEGDASTCRHAATGGGRPCV